MSKREIDRLVDSGLFYEVVEGSSIEEVEKKEIARKPAGSPEGGQFAETGGGGSSGTPSGKALSAKNAKDFNSSIDELYSSQGVKDWQAGDPYSDNSLGARQYFGNEQSFHINSGLRQGKMKDKSVAEGAKRFDKVFKNSSIDIPEGSTVHRAVSGKFAEQLKGMKAGESFTDEAYFSTAGVKSSTKGFGNVTMVLKTKGKQKAMVYKNENEVLFSPGRKVTIKSIKTSGDKHVIEAEIE